MDIVEIGSYATALVACVTLIGLVYRLIKIIVEFTKNLNCVSETHSKTLRAILRQMLIVKTDEIILKEKITKEEIYCIRKMFDNYKALGGNSTVEKRVEVALSQKTDVGEFDDYLKKEV